MSSAPAAASSSVSNGTTPASARSQSEKPVCCTSTGRPLARNVALRSLNQPQRLITYPCFATLNSALDCCTYDWYACGSRVRAFASVRRHPCCTSESGAVAASNNPSSRVALVLLGRFKKGSNESDFIPYRTPAYSSWAKLSHAINVV